MSKLNKLMARNETWVSEKRQHAINIILERIEAGESLRFILNKRNSEILPSRRVFMSWLIEDAQLSTQYARSCDIRSELMFEEIIEIADEASRDEDNPQAVSRARLQIDTRKWALSKMLPKKYGDKLDIDHTTQGEKLIFTPINLDVKEE